MYFVALASPKKLDPDCAPQKANKIWRYRQQSCSNHIADSLFLTGKFHKQPATQLSKFQLTNSWLKGSPVAMTCICSDMLA